MTSPLLLVIGISDEKGFSDLNRVVAKGMVSSILRSLFSGSVKVVGSFELPMFKVCRKEVDEIFSPLFVGGGGVDARQRSNHSLMRDLSDLVDPLPRQWVIVSHSRSLALRNIDHLIPMDLEGSYAPADVDFYWARVGKDEISTRWASPGLWAVRGEHLPLVLQRLEEEWSKESGAERGDDEEIWTRVVQQLPLRKRAFEKGEVVAPRIGAVDWEAVSNAAFVTVPDWPEKEAWKFLQALYFGTYLGDETGMMLNILEA